MSLPQTAASLIAASVVDCQGYLQGQQPFRLFVDTAAQLTMDSRASTREEAVACLLAGTSLMAPNGVREVRQAQQNTCARTLRSDTVLSLVAWS